MRIAGLVLGTAAAMLAAAPAMAGEHTVKMLNKGAGGMMVFEPALIKVKPGDTVVFVPSDKTHNAETIAGMVPAGAQPFKGKMNQPVKVTFTKPGVYGYKCTPHYGMGMVGAVVVGNAKANIADAQKVSHPGKAKQVMGTLLAQAGR